VEFSAAGHPRGDNARNRAHGGPRRTGFGSIDEFDEKERSMGDKSPKATQKKSAQKQAKTNESDSKKKQAITAQQATKLKAEAAKKK